MQIGLILLHLFEHICVLYTLISLTSRYLGTVLLKIPRTGVKSRSLGVLLFTILSCVTMLFPLGITEVTSLFPDLRIVVLVLAVYYFGFLDALAVTCMTAVISFPVIGTADTSWWFMGAVLCVGVTALIMDSMKYRAWGLLIAPVVVTIVHMAVFVPLYQENELMNVSLEMQINKVSQWLFIILSCNILGTIILNVALRQEVFFLNRLHSLRSRAYTDGLTGLLNRNRFDELFKKAFISEKLPISLLLIDIDHFKKYNDNFGHQEGDKVLQQVSHIIKSSIRKSDLAGRYGGEEFIIAMPGASIENASRLAESIRITIERALFNVGRVTVSIGISTYPQWADSSHSLVEQADKALYCAKSLQRNKTRTYLDTMNVTRTFSER